MNAAMLKALGLDALQQVLDNRVFRVLMALVLVPILIVFLIGFREDDIVLLFGIRRWSYATLLGLFGGQGVASPDADFQGIVVSGLVRTFVDFAGGSIGVLLTIAATSFFVPRMIEKGAADMLFYKPLHRTVLYLSRYAAGLLFIGLVSGFAVTGMYLGLLLVSGYNDPGILWAALTLTYLFGLIHGVSMLIGVMTRSTVASILASLIFFVGNGCVQKGWILKEQLIAMSAAEEQARTVDAAALPPADGEMPDGRERDEPAEPPDVEAKKDPGVLLTLLIGALDGAHYMLPKTTDADHIMVKLRSAFERGEPFFDETSNLTVTRLFGGLKRVQPTDAPPPVSEADGLLGDPVFAAENGPWRLVIRARAIGTGSDGSSLAVWRRSSGGTRVLASELADRIRAEQGLPGDEVSVESTRFGEHGRMSDMGPLFRTVYGQEVRWTAGDGSHRMTLIAVEGRVHAIEAVTPVAANENALAEWRTDLQRECGIKNAAAGEGWYRDQLGWDAPLRYNLLFSIGSSVAFVLAMLGFGAWRLSRIDF
jgi:ABC-type transport system involved in multi-copper enzyme maturation permease subunit